MPVFPIDNLDDPRLAIYRQVKHTNATRDLGLFVLEGEKLLRSLVSSRYEAASVLATDRALAEVEALVPAEVPIYVVRHEEISGLVGYKFHLGVMSAGVRRNPPELDATLEAGKSAMTLAVCPHIDNPENLGAIIRIVDVFGGSGVIAGEKCPDPLSRRVSRVSMGTNLRVPVWLANDLRNIVETLRAHHRFQLAAAVCHEPGAVTLEKFQRPARLALLLGNEGHGLGADWVDRCEHRLTIPMRPGAESLNVSVAAGILFYHLSTNHA